MVISLGCGWWVWMMRLLCVVRRCCVMGWFMVFRFMVLMVMDEVVMWLW